MSLCQVSHLGPARLRWIDGQTGTPADGDGCSAACKVETGWSCTGEPSECVYTVVCGDRGVGWGETCDDGNATSNDGCAEDCTVETGWICPVPGLACRPVCGDGILVGLEECEFTTDTPPTGCSETCRIEPGYDCVPDDGDPANFVCTLTVCGNGVTERGEQCDDGPEDLPFDGCYDCRLDPICSDGECESVCGDGQRYADEECDDGNTGSGDGCSADCEVEYGFYCEDITATPPPTVTLPVVARDFVGKDRQLPLATGSYHEDFNRHTGNGVLNMVKPQLGANGKPQWRWYPYIGTNIADAASGCSCDESATFVCRSESWDGSTVDFCAPPCSCTDGSTCLCDNTGHMYKEGGRANLSNPDNFGQWYTNVDDINLALPFELTLARNATTGNYVYNPGTDTFDPIGLGGWIAAGRESQPSCTVRNVSFTTETHFWFEYAGGERFDFSGDDDTWVFVAGQLVIDLGGLHVAHSGSLVLDTDTDGEDSGDTADGSASWWSPDMPGAPREGTPARIDLGLQPGGVYELVMFQAERNQCGSNFAVTLKDFNRPRSECESYCGDGIVSSDEACDLGTENNTGEHGGCNPDCTLAPYCGDGQVDADAGEVCDDGVNTTLYDNSQSGCAPGCVPANYCGDSEVDTSFGETCDNGTANSSDAYGPGACTAQCQTAPFCGDGLRNGTEQCDDGPANGTPASACDTSCQVKCGNGVVEAGEQCDDGAENNTGAYGGCRSDCTLAPYCGDGVRNGTEQCDDGKNDGSYGTCRSDCTLAPYCGDGTLDATAGELCDDGSANVSNGYGEGLCTTRCLPAPFCGDSTVDAQFGELCDDGDDNSDTAPGACRVDCSGYNPPGAACGNGQIDDGEQCDDGEANGTAQSSCDVRCQLKCGNGIKDAGEECDNGINDGSYGTCQPDCTLGEYCGDGVKNGPEQCDLGEDNEPAPYGSGKCTEQCTLAPYCGDRRLQSPPEECDGQPGCSSLCTWPLLI